MQPNLFSMSSQIYRQNGRITDSWKADNGKGDRNMRMKYVWLYISLNHCWKWKYTAWNDSLFVSEWMCRLKSPRKRTVVLDLTVWLLNIYFETCRYGNPFSGDRQWIRIEMYILWACVFHWCKILYGKLITVYGILFRTISLKYFFFLLSNIYINIDFASTHNMNFQILCINMEKLRSTIRFWSIISIKTKNYSQFVEKQY